MTYVVIPITGEGMDADIVSIPQYQEPSYAICPSCEEESDADGFCVDCDAFVTEHPPAVTLSEWQLSLTRLDNGRWQVAA